MRQTPTSRFLCRASRKSKVFVRTIRADMVSSLKSLVVDEEASRKLPNKKPRCGAQPWLKSKESQWTDLKAANRRTPRRAKRSGIISRAVDKPANHEVRLLS